MHRAGLVRIGVMAIVVIAASSQTTAQTVPASRADANRSASKHTSLRTTTGTVVGTAWRDGTTRYAEARMRLRDVQTGRGVAKAVADVEGRFRFEEIAPGPYVVELLSIDDKVMSVSELFGVTPGAEIVTVVRLSAKAPWFSGFFGNAAAAAIAAASTLGVTATGSNGQPVSAQ